jgi:hypothetical protein
VGLDRAKPDIGPVGGPQMDRRRQETALESQLEPLSPTILKKDERPGPRKGGRGFGSCQQGAATGGGAKALFDEG